MKRRGTGTLVLAALCMLCLALCLPGEACSGQLSPNEKACDPSPDKGDVVLPLPMVGGGENAGPMSLVFRVVGVQSKSVREPMAIRMGVGHGGRATLGEGERDACLYGMFEKGELPRTLELPKGGTFYFIGKYEVTNAQWRAVMGGTPGRDERPEEPKTDVSIKDLEIFLERCNSWLKTSPEAARMAKRPGISRGMLELLRQKDVFLRLPSEAEWEFAASGGIQGIGGTVGKLAETAFFNHDRAASIGSRKPNSLGIYDMLGNVSEIVCDRFACHGLTGGPIKKGGSHMSMETALDPGRRDVLREYKEDGTRLSEPDTGFRLVIARDMAQLDIPAAAVPGDGVASAGKSGHPEGGGDQSVSEGITPAELAERILAPALAFLAGLGAWPAIAWLRARRKGRTAGEGKDDRASACRKDEEEHGRGNVAGERVNGGTECAPKAPSAPYAVGSIVSFGAYPQSGGQANTEPILWRILAVRDHKVLLLSEYGLDCRKYHETYTATTWNDCDLRRWLKRDFYLAAFKEKKRIVHWQPQEHAETASASGSKESVFLLGVEELKEYLPSYQERKTAPTVHASEHGAWQDKLNGMGCWWLRTQGKDGMHAMYVKEDGTFSESGFDVDRSSVSVRPAIWIKE